MSPVFACTFTTYLGFLGCVSALIVLYCEFWSSRLELFSFHKSASFSDKHCIGRLIEVLVSCQVCNAWNQFSLEVLWFRPWIRIQSRIYSFLAIPYPDLDPVDSGIVTLILALGPDPESNFQVDGDTGSGFGSWKTWNRNVSSSVRSSNCNPDVFYVVFCDMVWHGESL